MQQLNGSWGFVTVDLTIKLKIAGLKVYLEVLPPVPEVKIHPLFEQ